jgi:peptidoglycan/xylan/chitin deacetylase (PgdA/CDA1 family)
LEEQDTETMSFLNSVVAPVLFPSIMWRTKSQAIHLTFDDGPHRIATPKVLDILSKRNIHATFFLVGANVQRNPEIAAELVRRGHTIGTHGQTHRSLIFKPFNQQLQEIRRANEVVKELLNLQPNYFRPPYGYFDTRTLRVARNENQTVVMWDVDPHDFSARRPGHIPATVSKQAKEGSILLLHDNEHTAGTVDQYLDPLIAALSDRGFVFAALTT